MLILIWASPITVGVVIAAIVVIIVVAIGTRRRRSDCRASRYAAPWIPPGVTSNWATGISGTTRYRSPWVAGPTSDGASGNGMCRSGASCHAIAAAVEPTGPHAPTMEAAGAHAAAVKSSASKATAPATSEGVVGNEAGANQNQRGHSSKNVAKHGAPPLLGVPCIIKAVRLRIGTRTSVSLLAAFRLDLNQTGPIAAKSVRRKLAGKLNNRLNRSYVGGAQGAVAELYALSHHRERQSSRRAARFSI
jgi:hypothetical protein